MVCDLGPSGIHCRDSLAKVLDFECTSNSAMNLEFIAPLQTLCWIIRMLSARTGKTFKLEFACLQPIPWFQLISYHSGLFVSSCVVGMVGFFVSRPLPWGLSVSAASCLAHCQSGSAFQGGESGLNSLVDVDERAAETNPEGLDVWMILDESPLPSHFADRLEKTFAGVVFESKGTTGDYAHVYTKHSYVSFPELGENTWRNKTRTPSIRFS